MKQNVSIDAKWILGEKKDIYSYSEQFFHPHPTLPQLPAITEFPAKQKFCSRPDTFMTIIIICTIVGHRGSNHGSEHPCAKQIQHRDCPCLEELRAHLHCPAIWSKRMWIAVCSEVLSCNSPMWILRGTNLKVPSSQ